MKKSFFEPVDLRVAFPLLEKQILNNWYKKGIVEKYLHKNDASLKKFSFFDGPITANNPMGVHHAWGRTYKDLWQRYKNMNGYKQRFQNGFDCQGLWVEVEVEKELGFNSKKEIEEYGIDKFSSACRARVNKYSQIQTEQSKRLGNFMDWDNSYYTFTDKNIEYIWYFLKECYKKGWLYKGFRSLPWCARCGTSLSQHELTDSYKEMIHNSVFFKLPILNTNKEYFLVWTTTPWTLAANVALAVNPNLLYLKVKVNDEVFVLAEESIKILKEKYEVIEEIKGSSLVNLKYKGPFDELPSQKISQRVVIPWDDVSGSEGTGIVHIAPGCGEEDFELGKKYHLSVLVPLDENGNYVKGYGELYGKNAHNVDEIIFSSLINKSMLYSIEPHKHSYPICWRCKLPIVFRAEENWFISAKEIRPKMLRQASKIKWHPLFVGKLMKDWLKNMGDWNISRKRYFGLPLPIFECQCGQITIVGSKDELKRIAIDQNKVDKLPELHRPWIDVISIKCPKCRKEVNRITELGDCWLDAGIIPFSTLDYLDNKKYWQEWYPASWVSEMREQVRLWFYSMLFMGVTLEEKSPYLEVLSYEKLYDEKGKPMHKSAGNAVWFDEAVEKMGADVMRWMYARQSPADNLLFGFNVADETRRQFHLKLWNIYNFFITYANLDGYRPKKKSDLIPQNPELSVLDKWILLRLNETIIKVSKLLDNYDAYLASEEIEQLVDDISNWFIRRSRDKVGPAAESKDLKIAFYDTTYFVLVTLSKLIAPFTPFLAEAIYTNLTKDESVHLTQWPSTNKDLLGKENEKLLKEMEKIREIIEKVHSVRKQNKIPVRQPLNEVKIFNPDQLHYGNDILELAKEELNIKKIIFLKGKNRIELDIRITPQLEEEAKARELIRQIQEGRKKLGLNLNQKARVTSPWLPKDKTLIKKIIKKSCISSLKKKNKLEILPN